MIPKNKRVKDPKYLKAISSYGCVITGQEAIPHHLKGYKQGSMKVSDYLTFPLSDRYHSACYDTGLHKNIIKWELEHGYQTKYVRETLSKALYDNLIDFDTWQKNTNICWELENKFR